MQKNYFKQFVLTVSVLLCGMVLEAQDFEVGGIRYNILSESDLTVEVISRINEYTGEVIIPATVTYESKILTVKEIEDHAFKNCSGLTSVIIGDSVTSINYAAFRDCTGLTSVTIGNSVTGIEGYAFYGCSSLTSVTIGNSVEYIGSYAFYGCNSIEKVEYNCKTIEGWFSSKESIKEVVIGNSVTSIGYIAFAGCTGLTNIEIPNSVTSISERAFAGCTGLTNIEIPNSVTSISEGAFWGCEGLTSIEIPNSVTLIDENAFYCCTGLTSIEIPNSVTSIGDYAFEGCGGLTNIAIPSSVTSVGNSAFYGCTGLTSITIPSSVTNIGDCAFEDCGGLTSIVVDNDNSVYDSREGCNAIIHTATNTLIQGCNNSTIPSSVTRIGTCAFAGCTGLTSITIPSSVINIGDYAFEDCGGLTSIVVDNDNSVYDSREGCNAIIHTATNTLIQGCNNTTIPSSVTSIGNSAFSDCFGLTSIEIPNSVTSIGERTFWGCEGLTSLYLLCETPPSVMMYCFTESQYANATLYVPQGSLSAYQTANIWKEFCDIQEFDVTGIDDISANDVAIKATANGIALSDVTGRAVVVYAANGMRIANIDSYAGEEIILDKSVYIVQVGNKTIKVKL